MVLPNLSGVSLLEMGALGQLNLPRWISNEGQQMVERLGSLNIFGFQTQA
jgi:hypothetical protein